MESRAKKVAFVGFSKTWPQANFNILKGPKSVFARRQILLEILLLSEAEKRFHIFRKISSMAVPQWRHSVTRLLIICLIFGHFKH